MLKPLFLLLLIASLFAEETVSLHAVQLAEERLCYTATVESGEISSISYIKEGENRPITFVFNGGPGSSSVWLHIGAFGPRRLVAHEEGQSILPPYRIIDNLETILDLTDLVFIDPMGTGFSKKASKEEAEKHYTIGGDIEAVGLFIRDFLTKNKRWNSPKYIAGESYGALRAAGLSEYLQNEFALFLDGLILISGVIDFQTLLFDPDNVLPYFLFLPSYAATFWYHGCHIPEIGLEDAVQAARDFVYKTYAPSLICPGCFDAEMIHKELAAMTGLPLELIQRWRGRIDVDDFVSHFLASERKMVGRFDARMTGYSNSLLRDPSDALPTGIFAGAFHDYLHKELGVSGFYHLLSFEVNKQWNFQNYNEWGYPNLMGALRNALVINPNMKIFFGCGYFDLVTPFAVSEYCADHLDVPHTSVQMEYYEGGHMFYLNPSARIKFKRDLVRFYEKAS